MGATLGRGGGLAVQVPYGLNYVQGWGLSEGADVCVCGGGGVEAGGGVGWVSNSKNVRHTKSISLQNSFCESHAWRLVS